MVSLLDFIPIISIFAIGVGTWKILSKIDRNTYRITEYYNLFLILGLFCLIPPLTLIGIQQNGTLSLSILDSSISIISFQNYCMIFLLIGLILSLFIGYYVLRKVLDHLEDFKFDSTILKDFRIILLIILFLDYLILELILPLRGFDALYYYFPETEVFYQAGRITEVNYLSFFPVVKSPFNVLLYLFTYYTTNMISIQLIPFIFLIGLVLLVFDFSIELFNDKSLALTASILTLTLPLIYWLMNYWAFYQDLYVCYFFSASCYFSLKMYRSSSKLIIALMLCICIIISLLTKITAWVLPIILILWIPSGLKGKIIRIAIISVLGVFLCIQAATRIYIGASIVIFVLYFFVIYIIIKEETVQESSGSFYQVFPIGLGMLLGSFWLLDRISLSRSVWDEIYNLYFKFIETIVWVYPSPPQDPLLTTLERVHGINFFSATFIIVLGTVFVLPWFILKISAIKSFKIISAPIIWLFVFFGIWVTYYLNSSIRYLAPLIIPLILCVTWGFSKLTENIANPAKKDFLLILFAFFGCFNFYYLIPIESLSITNETQEVIGIAYNQAAYNYYLHPEILFFFTIGISVILLGFITEKPLKLIQPIQTRINFIHARRVLFFFVILIPIAVQSYLVLYTQGDLTQFHAIHEYEYRFEYQELVEVIKQQNQPLSAILTVKTPGLQFFTGQPVVDIYYQNEIFRNNPFFTFTNLTKLIDVLRYPFQYIVVTDNISNLNLTIQFIVVPSIYNIYYEIYSNQIERNSFLFQSLENQQYFSLIFRNSDFKLYEVLFPS